MYHQLSDREIANIHETIRETEDGMGWFIGLVSLGKAGDKSNENQNKREESEGAVIPCQQCL